MNSYLIIPGLAMAIYSVLLTVSICQAMPLILE